MKKDIDIKNRMRQIRYVTEHFLNKEQVKSLFEKKMRRAELYSQSLKKREALLRGR